MPVPATISIKIDGVDITDKVLFSTANFSAQSGGGVGTFSFTVKDVDRTEDYVTGKKVSLTLDGYQYFAGYLMQIGSTFAFPAVDTASLPAVTARQLVCTGTNYNVLFDRLVAHNNDDHLHAFPDQDGTQQAGEVVRHLVNNYLDVPAALTMTHVDDVGQIVSDADIAQANAPGREFNWVNGGEQGISWRRQMDWSALFNGAIYYIDAQMDLHYHAPENFFARWGFSDRPNKSNVTASATNWTGATYGFREMTATDDISQMVNDAFVWGGSEFIASPDPDEPSGTIFARSTDTDSIARHGRWQYPETHFGQLGRQAGVNGRAYAIVPPPGTDRPPGIGSDGVVRNRTVAEPTLTLTWFAHDVPTLGPAHTVKDHLIPGQIVTIILYVHGTNLAHPLILTLPLRSVSISFPTLPPNPAGQKLTYARFVGTFGLSQNDPFSLWEAILNRKRIIRRRVNSAGSQLASGPPGGIWSDQPDEAPNGTRQVFTLSSLGDPIVYMAGSSEVYLNSLMLREGADYMEHPNQGQIQIFAPPPTGSTMRVTVRLAG